MRVASPLRFGLLVLSLLCTLLLAASAPAQASHFRYGSLTWQTVSTNAAGQTTVKFKVTQAFREDFPWAVPPVVGGTEYTGPLDFGDGNSAPINLVITSINFSDISFFGEAEITHTYAAAPAGTKYTALYTSNARIGTLQNNANQAWNVFTDVTVGTTNNSPVSTLPAIVNLAVGQAAATFTVPGSDSSPLTFSLVPSGGLAPYASFIQAPGLSITPTGVASFPTTGKSIGALYNAIVAISDGSTTIMVDFIIRMVGPSQSPLFDYSPGLTPADGSTIQVVAGNAMSFNVQAYDPDAGDVVTLQGTGLPPGSVFPAVAAANPVASTFSWTPTAGDVGPHVLSFTAQDPAGVQALTSVTINVTLCNLSLQTSSSDVTCNGGSNGTVDLTVTGATGTPTYAWTGPGTFTATTEDLTGLSPGTYSVTVTDANNCRKTATATVGQPAPVPTPVITPTATSSVFTGGPVTTIYLGYGPQSVQLTASNGDGTYSWSPAAGLSTTTGATVLAAPTTTTTYTVTATNAAGCTATATITIAVIDVRCGNKNDKVLVCHNGHEICISPNAVNTHLTSPSHTDYLGACQALGRSLAADNTAAVDEAASLEAYPNPAAGQATVSFRNATASPAKLLLYNYLGAVVATLYDGPTEAGQLYSVTVDSKNLPSGVYYCRLAINGEVRTTRLSVVK
ncbi:hypothetical protein GCM10022409_18610 [Hymenobacter glaciei]|uniref:Secretion system C-terminal sorting domain-containing protein n=1 Tax=Hymenobacter glaciei TaxID=877209 RepID=A0ABP7U264_9BACT